MKDKVSKINYCNKCGRCCEAITLSHSIESVAEVHKSDPNNKDAFFIIKNWIPITKDEFISINPFVYEQIKDSDNLVNFYKCTKFDPLTRMCSDHKNRPDVCRDFPYYQKFFNINNIAKLSENFSFYSKDCGYKKAVVNKSDLNFKPCKKLKEEH